MRKNMRFYGGPGALVVLRDRDEILLNKNARDVVDRKQFSRQRRLVRFRIALREVETARRLRSQFHGLRREELETEGIGRLLDLDEDGARPARRGSAQEGRCGAHRDLFAPVQLQRCGSCTCPGAKLLGPEPCGGCGGAGESFEKPCLVLGRSVAYNSEQKPKQLS